MTTKDILKAAFDRYVRFFIPSVIILTALYLDHSMQNFLIASATFLIYNKLDDLID